MSNPYRRALLVESLQIKTEKEKILEAIQQHFPLFLKNVIEIHGISILRALGVKAKNIFKKNEEKQQSGNNIISLPDGQKVRIRSNF